jgi:uncharacterized protein YlxW (UPF0749 family)
LLLTLESKLNVIKPKLFILTLNLYSFALNLSVVVAARTHQTNSSPHKERRRTSKQLVEISRSNAAKLQTYTEELVSLRRRIDKKEKQLVQQKRNVQLLSEMIGDLFM